MNIIRFIILMAISLQSFAKEHPGFFCRIIKTSKNKSIILLDLGREKNIQENDHALLSYHGKNVAKVKVMQLSSTRSMWQVVESVMPKDISTNNVYHFKFISAKIFTEDKGDLPKTEIKAKYKSPFPYPFDSKAKLLLGLESGSRYRSDFDYPIRSRKGNHGQRYEGSLAWIWRSSFEHRVYWGPILKLQDQKNEFDLIDNTGVIERRKRLTIGPLAEITFWGNEKYSLTGQFQLSANLDRVSISYNNLLGLSNEAQFSGLSFGHSVGLHWTINYLIGKSHLSLGINAQTDYPHTLKNNDNFDPAIFPEDQIKNRTHTNYLFRIGLHIPIWI